MYDDELKKLIKDLEKILQNDKRWEENGDSFLRSKMKRITAVAPDPLINYVPIENNLEYLQKNDWNTTKKVNKEKEIVKLPDNVMNPGLKKSSEMKQNVPKIKPFVPKKMEQTIKPIIIPKMDTTIEQKPKQFVPKIEPIIQSKMEPTIQPKMEPTIQPKMEPTVQPKMEPTVQPKMEPMVQPKMEPTIQPKMEPMVQPKMEPMVQPIEKIVKIPDLFRNIKSL